MMNRTTIRQAPLPVSVPGEVVRDHDIPPPLSDLNRLTTRETEVLQLIGLGYSIQEIGVELHLSSHTIVSYRKSLWRKLHCKKATQLAVMAERLGLLTGLSFHF